MQIPSSSTSQDKREHPADERAAEAQPPFDPSAATAHTELSHDAINEHFKPARGLRIRSSL